MILEKILFAVVAEMIEDDETYSDAEIFKLLKLLKNLVTYIESETEVV